MLQSYLQLIFQFLLVRLIERRSIIPNVSWNISIPFGSINSLQLRLILCRLYKFQFLLVRLIASGKISNTKVTGISIPFGSINSSPSIVKKYITSGFQFLLVRLIGSAKYRSVTVSDVFQFLLVRLIAWNGIRHKSSDCISIPFGSINSTS